MVKAHKKPPSRIGIGIAFTGLWITITVACIYFSPREYNVQNQCHYGISAFGAELSIMCHEVPPPLPDRPPLFFSEL